MSNAVFIYLTVEVRSGIVRMMSFTLNSSPVQETKRFHSEKARYRGLELVDVWCRIYAQK